MPRTVFLFTLSPLYHSFASSERPNSICQRTRAGKTYRVRRSIPSHRPSGPHWPWTSGDLGDCRVDSPGARERLSRSTATDRRYLRDGDSTRATTSLVEVPVPEDPVWTSSWCVLEGDHRRYSTKSLSGNVNVVLYIEVAWGTPRSPASSGVSSCLDQSMFALHVQDMDSLSLSFFFSLQ